MKGRDLCVGEIVGTGHTEKARWVVVRHDEKNVYLTIQLLQNGSPAPHKGPDAYPIDWDGWVMPEGAQPRKQALSTMAECLDYYSAVTGE